MMFERKKSPQPHCRGFASCTCIDDPKTIRKHVFIELTSKCNFNCDFCVYKISKRKKEFMDLDILKRILKDLKKLKPIEYIMFSALGEPLLHPKFDEACRLVKKFKFNLVVTTNGSLLKEKIKQLPIDEMYISLETPTKRSFKMRNAKHMKFEDYIQNICNFAKDVPFYTILYLFRENNSLFPKSKDLISMKNKGKSIKLIEKIGKKINPEFRMILNNDVKDMFRNFFYITPNTKFYFRNFSTWSNCIIPKHSKLEEARSIPNCSYYKHHINILSNGEATFCCMDYDGVMGLGNVKNESLKKIYSRKKRNIDLAVFPFCRKCRGKLVQKNDDKK